MVRENSVHVGHSEPGLGESVSMLTQSIVNRTMVMILAGGEGKRLYPLTSDRAKPSVPFGGRYRLIDFVLSNFINSGFFKIKVLTQYKSDSLNRHLNAGWNLTQMIGQYVEAVPAQMRHGKEWYRGNADAIFQNLNLIADERPRYVCIFGADHIYKMDVRQMLAKHLEVGAEVSVAAIPVPRTEASAFGIVEVDADNWMVGFEEKPKNPKAMPTDPDHSLVSMGNYIFNTDVLVEELVKNAERSDTTHDFGRDIIEKIHQRRRVHVYDFNTNVIGGEASTTAARYWRDVGTLDAYYEASMDLVSVSPQFNMYNPDWPIYSVNFRGPPAKFVFGDVDTGRVGVATDSLVSEGCIVSGGHVDHSILFPSVRVNSFASVKNSILFEGVEVGRHAIVKNAILEKGVVVEPNAAVGVDLEADKRRWFVSDSGVVVVPKYAVVRNRTVTGEIAPLEEMTDPTQTTTRRLKRIGVLPDK